MKYPQLVSTRAVNAISDWLVSRLEQLGVEAPQIYTRLLLSLLQSSVQINDPIEFSSLETFIGNRKGGNLKRYLQCDANTLKKLNAVQCLSEIVSSEQELTTIENLVDELWEKLKDIEKQLDYANGNGGGGGETILVDYLANNSKEALTEQSVLSATKTENSNNSNNNNKNNNNKNEKIVSVNGSAETGNESETDPKKRYFNAFPALSKEMEDSFRIWRRNAKSLTWPADRGNMSASSSNLVVNMSTSFGETSNEEKEVDTLAHKEIPKTHDFNTLDDLVNSGNIIPPKLENFCSSANFTAATAACGLKRKTKRRKSQSMSKGRTMPSMRRSSGMNDNVITNIGAVGNAYGARRQNRHMSPTQWDTDFEGYWEMGRDLIKEFFAKQGDKNRKRCSSENGAYTVDKETNIKATSNVKETNSKGFEAMVEDAFKLDTNRMADNQTPPLWAHVDISFCCDDSIDDDDTFKSITELTADTSLNNFRTSPRRLYERNVNELPVCAGGESESTSQAVQTDLVKFEAKFNSSVAALWQDASDEETPTSNEEPSLWSAPNNVPWSNVAPIKENLKNFWTTFYNQFDSAKVLDEDKIDSVKLSMSSISDMETNSLPYSNILKSDNHINANNDAVDFHSMPNNFDNFDKLGGNMKGGDHDRCKTPVSVFLQDSIWSENLNGDKNTDTDESFYLKVWNSNKKLYNLDAVYETKITESSNENKSSDSAAFQFMNYGKSKWSEGINAGPTISQQQQVQHQNQQEQQQKPQSLLHQQQPQQQNQLQVNVGGNSKGFVALNQQQKNSNDCTDASVSTSTSCSSLSYTLSSSGIFSVQTPSMPPNLQSWAANSDSKSLTETYGINSPIDKNSLMSPKRVEEETPTVSLSNHSNESSGFVEYSRVKSLSKSSRPEIIRQQQRNYQTQYPLPKPQRYPDDENLLTSERTHFQPIKAYADGYTFDVCSTMDVINYKRSESGYLYFESDKYLEYTRNDNFMPEDADTSAGMSTAPLYAGSNCEAATAQKRKKERKDEELVLKFRIMNREMACQTDDEATIKSMYEAQQHPLYLIFSGASTDGMKIRTSGQACSDALEALNKAVAAAAKAAAERDRLQLDTPWLRLNEVIGSSRNALGSSLIWTAVQTPRDETGVDEIDFGNESSSCAFSNAMDLQWSMNEFDKRCQQHNEGCIGSGGVAMNAANNNSVGMQHNNGEMHSLWGICAACNTDYESAPANHLLRDELNLEADEIMSDLKNMQDLYIGYGAGGANECIDSDSTTEFLWGRPNEEQRRKKITQPKATRMTKNQAIAADDDDDDGDDETLGWEHGRRQKETHQKVLQQVNKLIADLMRPEKANDTNVLADAAASAHRELGESLWPDDGEHNIWKHQMDSCNSNFSNTDEKPNSNSGARTSLNSNTVMLAAEEKRFLAQLTWEHDNLSQIWAKETPPLNREAPKIISKSSSSPTPPSQPPALLCSLPSNSDVDKIQVYNDAEKDESCLNSTTEINNKSGVESHCEEQTKPTIQHQQHVNSGENFKNEPLLASAVGYKRIQQLLNSSCVSHSVTTSKLKLANRKRRHSASQNYTIFHNGVGIAGAALYASSHKSQSTSSSSNNNNNTKVTDLNNFHFKRNALAGGSENSADAAHQTVTSSTNTANIVDDVDMEQSEYDPAAYFIFNNADGVVLPPKQTIITCKYWTTIDPMTDAVDADNIDCAEGTTFSCLMDKNDAILKHVTMLARPLTR